MLIASPESTSQNPAAIVRNARQSLGVTQRELADLLGVHPMSVSKWERARVEPGRSHLELLRALELAAKQTGVVVVADTGDDRRLARLAALLGRAFATIQGEIAMELSASNVLRGVVSSVRRGAVTARVAIRVAPGVEVVSVVTVEAVDRLGLVEGTSVLAIVKATDVVLGRE